MAGNTNTPHLGFPPKECAKTGGLGLGGALPMGFVRFARINSRKGDTFLMNVDRENLMDFFRHLTWKVHFDTKKIDTT